MRRFAICLEHVNRIIDLSSTEHHRDLPRRCLSRVPKVVQHKGLEIRALREGHNHINGRMLFKQPAEISDTLFHKVVYRVAVAVPPAEWILPCHHLQHVIRLGIERIMRANDRLPCLRRVDKDPIELFAQSSLESGSLHLHDLGVRGRSVYAEHARLSTRRRLRVRRSASRSRKLAWKHLSSVDLLEGVSCCSLHVRVGILLSCLQGWHCIRRSGAQLPKRHRCMEPHTPLRVLGKYLCQFCNLCSSRTRFCG
mmetsp:Transcript_72363/g.132441  ORF Transcript_72363/g.132441 Transcript_72363/m.132441 type:complete len:253 (-) Transcript_72363:814-1572(-)